MIKLFTKKTDSRQSIILPERHEPIQEMPKVSIVEKLQANIDMSSVDLKKFADTILINIAKEKEIMHGLFLLFDGKSSLKAISGYAVNQENIEEISFEVGEGLPGQVAFDRKTIILRNVPDGYIQIETGLGKASPASLIILPVCTEEKLIGVFELASFKQFTSEDESHFSEISEFTARNIQKIQKTKKNKNGK
jgi:putative methionine-R-sulfoxide reductase with GAF domain